MWLECDVNIANGWKVCFITGEFRMTGEGENFQAKETKVKMILRTY